MLIEKFKIYQFLQTIYHGNKKNLNIKIVDHNRNMQIKLNKHWNKWMQIEKSKYSQ